MGAVRAGFAPFLISPRNGPDAVAHLLRKTQAGILFTGVESAIQTLAQKSLALLRNSQDDPIVIQSCPMPLHEDLYPSRGNSELEVFPEREYGLDSPALILHSSGTWLDDSYNLTQALIPPHRIRYYGLPQTHRLDPPVITTDRTRAMWVLSMLTPRFISF